MRSILSEATRPASTPISTGETRKRRWIRRGAPVAPRAANDAGAQFVAVGFGLLIDPLEEDASQVAAELTEAGYGADVLKQAREITDATGNLMAEHFLKGYEQLAAVKARYGKAPWFAKIKGEFTGGLLALDEATLRREGAAKFDNLDLDWRYDAMGWMRKVKAPQLWVIAAEDREAPPQDRRMKSARLHVGSSCPAKGLTDRGAERAGGVTAAGRARARAHVP